MHFLNAHILHIESEINRNKSLQNRIIVIFMYVCISHSANLLMLYTFDYGEDAIVKMDVRKNVKTTTKSIVLSSSGSSLCLPPLFQGPGENMKKKKQID